MRPCGCRTTRCRALYTPQGQVAVLSPAVLFPEMFPKDPYDMDSGWRPKDLCSRWKARRAGPVREFGRPPNHDDYLKFEDEFEKRTMAFIHKNAAAKKPFFVAWWPALGSMCLLRRR